MNLNSSICTIQNQKRNLHKKKTILKPEIVVQSGVPELDRLTGGFRTGELTFINGYSNLVNYIPSMIYINTYRTFYSDTIYIDGGMCANPYKISKYAKKMGINPREILRHIHISRAFTVYQLSTIIQEMLEPIIKKCKPKTLIIGMFPLLYLDPDISPRESKELLKNNLQKIRKLAEKYELFTIFTNQDKTLLSNYRNLRKIIYSNVDETVQIRHIDQRIYINLIKGKQETTIVRFARGQLNLQDFGLVM